jgi:hypothetical protein
MISMEVKEKLDAAAEGGLIPGQTGRLAVGLKITLTLQARFDSSVVALRVVRDDE